jgi:osmotically-inducible protein OsmY
MNVKGIKGWTGTAVLMGCLGAASILNAQPPTGQDSYGRADNTAVNQRDRNGNEPTAGQQKNNRPDREITRQIRRALTNDKTLSTYAHNVKVITQNGQVTLKGPVRSDEEKRSIEAKAQEIAGANKVTSELDIQPKD